MSEKYTIENIEDTIPFGWTLLENLEMIGQFDTKENAQLICRLLNEDEKRKSAPNKIKFKQIQCVSVPNTEYTQCNVFMYGLDEDGVLWFKRECDFKWLKEPLEC